MIIFATFFYIIVESVSIIDLINEMKMNEALKKIRTPQNTIPSKKLKWTVLKVFKVKFYYLSKGMENTIRQSNLNPQNLPVMTFNPFYEIVRKYNWSRKKGIS